MNTKQIHINDILKLLREINDESKQAVKTLRMFSDSDNWNDRYTDTHGRIDRFSYLNIDPRILSDSGLKAAKLAEDKSWQLWQMLCDPIRTKEFEAITLINTEVKANG